MSRAANSLRTSDVITTPIKLKYTSSYSCDTLGLYGMEVMTGINGPVTITGSIPQETINYLSIRHLYYSNYLTGSYPVSASSADNYLQSTAASGTFDADVRYFPTESGARVTVLSIPRGVFGQQISRQGFIMSSSAYLIVDDGNGNLLDITTGSTDYIVNGYFDAQNYFQSEALTNVIHVGNIIYPQGMVIFTNPDYLDIVACPTTTTSTTTTTTTPAGPTTTTTSTTTTTTTPVPTTTTSTTTTTTTPEPTTTTTSTTTTTTTPEPTTTSTTTTTTTPEPTTTTTSTTTTTTTAIPEECVRIQVTPGIEEEFLNCGVFNLYNAYTASYYVNCTASNAPQNIEVFFTASGITQTLYYSLNILSGSHQGFEDVYTRIWTGTDCEDKQSETYAITVGPIVPTFPTCSCDSYSP